MCVITLKVPSKDVFEVFQSLGKQNYLNYHFVYLLDEKVNEI
jgi:hypothetical protein